MFKMFIILIQLFFLLISNASSEYTSLIWSQCPTPGSEQAIKIDSFSINPMPLTHASHHTVDFKAYVNRDIKGVWQTSVNMIRTVAGLALPIRCTIVQGNPLGSCNYDDMCKAMETVLTSPETDSMFFTLLGGVFGYSEETVFKCPMTIQPGDVVLNNEFDLPDFSQTILSFLATGDFDITIKSFDNSNRSIICLNVKFSIKKRVPPQADKLD